jgi:undecaprenyl-diphosphatase
LDIALWVKAAVMGIVEGLTEFLPISSTGHLILAASLLDFTGDKIKVFEIAIQTGAMFAVIWEYRIKLGSTVSGIARDPVAQRFARNLLIAFLPAVAFGLAFNKAIKEHLFHPVPVAMAFIAGALIILWVEKRHHRRYGERDLEGRRHARVETVDDMNALDALKVGLVQCFALIPGTSRSGATIIGGLLCGLSRRTAAEFSFFVAIPVLVSATVYELYKERAAIAQFDTVPLVVSCVVSFASALLAVKFLIRFVSRHSFAAFAWYRIVFGGLILLTAWTGLVRW